MPIPFQTFRHKSAELHGGGFTLLELSVVLVILGLFLAGVFVGKHLVMAANVRSTISTKEEFDVAVQSFWGMQKYYPGDIPVPQIANAAPRAGTNARGDGDGIVENAGLTTRYMCSENLLFWSDLHKARLITKAGEAATDGTSGSCVPTTINFNTGLGSYLPKSEWGKTAFWWVYYDTTLAKHYYVLNSVTSLAPTGEMTGNAYVLPLAAALAIEQKIDDNNPSTGKVMANFRSSGSTFFSDPWDCIQFSGSSYVNTSIDGHMCNLMFETKW